MNKFVHVIKPCAKANLGLGSYNNIKTYEKDHVKNIVISLFLTNLKKYVSISVLTVPENH